LPNFTVAETWPLRRERLALAHIRPPLFEVEFPGVQRFKVDGMPAMLGVIVMFDNRNPFGGW
jgi:hypothetical protein